MKGFDIEIHNDIEMPVVSKYEKYTYKREFIK